MRARNHSIEQTAIECRFNLGCISRRFGGDLKNHIRRERHVEGRDVRRGGSNESIRRERSMNSVSIANAWRPRTEVEPGTKKLEQVDEDCAEVHHSDCGDGRIAPIPPVGDPRVRDGEAP